MPPPTTQLEKRMSAVMLQEAPFYSTVYAFLTVVPTEPLVYQNILFIPQAVRRPRLPASRHAVPLGFFWGCDANF